MDMSCALHRLNIIYSSESSTGCSGNQCPWPRSRSGDKKFRWNELRVKWKNITVPRCFNNGSRALSSGVFQNLLFLNSKHLVNRGRRRIYLSQCSSNDSKMSINGDDNKTGSMESGNGETGIDQPSKNVTLDQGITNPEEEEMNNLVDLRKSLQKQLKELEAATINSRSLEEKAQNISETAISLKDLSSKAWNNVSSTLDSIQDIVNQESVVNTSFQKASVAFYLAKARIKAAEVDRLAESSEISGVDPPENRTEGVEVVNQCSDKDVTHSNGEDIVELKANLEGFEVELSRLKEKKNKLQQDLNELNSLAEKTQMEASKAEEDVANAMMLAEQAVAFELEVSQLVNDAEIALHNAEKSVSMSKMDASELSLDEVTVNNEKDDNSTDVSGYEYVQPLSVRVSSEDVVDVSIGKSSSFEDSKDILSDSPQGAKIEEDKCKIAGRIKKFEKLKDLPKDDTSFTTPKSHTKKSSRFFPASFFSFSSDGTKFTPLSALHNLSVFAQRQFPKLIVGFLLLGAGFAICMNKSKPAQFLKQSNIVSSMEEVSSITKPFFEEMQKLPNIIRKIVNNIPRQELNAEEASLHDILWLLLASVIVVPIFQRIPGGSPVLGYLAAGIFIGPYGLSIIRHVHGTKAVAEFGVVFLLFNIGLELSVERLSSMKKYVFGLGSAQVLATSLAIGLVASLFTGQTVPAAIVIGSGLALSSTAVVLQVLQERRESTARHGRAAFSVLLFQDLAVVVLLILIPLISPSSSGGGVGFQAIAGALGLAGVKAIAAIVAIIAGGRLLLRPIYKQIAENQNTEIFSANTLLVVLGTSLLTAKAGLSMALGAFLAGLLLAETEFALQVESDIAPYRGLLLGLFFITVGMSIDPKLLISNFPVIMGMLGLLICGKAAIVAIVGKVFGISFLSALRVGLLLAPGGEFAFVAFGEAANQLIISPQLSSMLFLVVGLSMALTPWLAIGGQLIASRFELSDVRSLVPVESETDDLRGHIIICGFGRVGQIIAQLLSERLIPFVALDVRSDRVTIGRGSDVPVFFGDPGSREILHKVGAERACAAAIAMDTPGANYRTVWAFSKYFPHVKTFVRAHDIDHGINLEKAGATAVVPEILEPSLQLAAAVLAQAKIPMSEISTTINEFRSRHLSELTELSEVNGSSLGYGYSRVMEKPNGDVRVGLPESTHDKESEKSEETPTDTR